MATKPLRGSAQGVLREFLSILHTEDSYARSARFEVVIQPPKSLTRPEGMHAASALALGEFSKDGTNRNISLKCNTVNMPGRTVAQIEDNTLMGPSRSFVTGTPTYADITAQFTMLNSNGQDRRFFEAWQGSAVSEADFSVNYYNDYVGQVDMYLLNEKNERKYGIRLQEAFPKVIGDLQLSGDQKNQLATMEITFSYRYWEILEGGSTIPKKIESTLGLIGNAIERNLLSRIPKVLRNL